MMIDNAERIKGRPDTNIENVDTDAVNDFFLVLCCCCVFPDAAPLPIRAISLLSCN